MAAGYIGLKQLSVAIDRISEHKPLSVGTITRKETTINQKYR